MLCFELTNEGREVHIDYDEQGMAILLAALEKLQKRGGHVHLLTPSNGGRELDESTPWGAPAIGEVIVTCNSADN